MVSQSEIYNGHDGGVCRTQPRDLGACTSQIQADDECIFPCASIERSRVAENS